ncbi:histidine kinase [Streptomonospora sediminis]
MPPAVGLFRGRPPGAVASYYLALALAWGIGSRLPSSARAAQAERSRAAAADRTAERTRIARELHDGVAHNVTAMVVQAESARYLAAAPDRLDQSLTAVSETGRRAIADLRHLLGLLDLLHPADGTGRAESTESTAAAARATRTPPASLNRRPDRPAPHRSRPLAPVRPARPYRSP